MFPLTHPHVNMSAHGGRSCPPSADLLDVDIESLDASDAPEWTQSTTISEVSSLEDFGDQIVWFWAFEVTVIDLIFIIHQYTFWIPGWTNEINKQSHPNTLLLCLISTYVIGDWNWHWSSFALAGASPRMLFGTSFALSAIGLECYLQALGKTPIGGGIGPETFSDQVTPIMNNTLLQSREIYSMTV